MAASRRRNYNDFRPRLKLGAEKWRDTMAGKRVKKKISNEEKPKKSPTKSKKEKQITIFDTINAKKGSK
jgi:hypothetical protein